MEKIPGKAERVRIKPANCKKPPGAISKKTKDAISLAVKYDIPAVEAYQIVNGTPPHKNTVATIEKAVETWSLRHPKAMKSASKTIKAFAAGEEVNGIKPKDSTVLAAATRIADINDPIIRKSENLNVNITSDPVDLSKYRRN